MSIIMSKNTYKTYLNLRFLLFCQRTYKTYFNQWFKLSYKTQTGFDYNSTGYENKSKITSRSSTLELLVSSLPLMKSTDWNIKIYFIFNSQMSIEISLNVTPNQKTKKIKTQDKTKQQ